MKYLDIFKKHHPLSNIEFPDENTLYNHEVPFFIVKKLY